MRSPHFYRVLPALAVFSCLSACGQLFGGSGGNACQSSTLLGTWGTGSETISFSSSCGFTSTICGARATATSAPGSTGNVDLTGWSVSGQNCAAQANRHCTYAITGSTLKLSCDPAGGGTYTKQ